MMMTGLRKRDIKEKGVVVIRGTWVVKCRKTLTLTFGKMASKCAHMRTCVLKISPLIVLIRHWPTYLKVE